jgi:hypothetical protein
MLPSNAAAVVGAGVVSVLIFPAAATALNRPARRHNVNEPALGAGSVTGDETADEGLSPGVASPGSPDLEGDS